jgi:type VII secretion integral membrane protein EccD
LSAATYAYAAPGAVLLAAGSGALGLAQVLVGCATLVFTAVVSLIAIGLSRQVHLAMLAVGVLVGLGGFLAIVTTAAAASAATAVVLLLAAPWLPRIAAHQGGMPDPTVPRPSVETPEDEPFPAPNEIANLVRRSDDVLTGLLWGMCVTLLVAVLVLAGARDISASLLAAAIVVVCALRARAFAAVRHRLPLLAVAGLGSLGLPLLWWEGIGVDSRVSLIAPALAVALLAAIGAFAAGRAYAVKPPSPQLGRLGDITEFVLIAASAILATAIAGLFGFVRGLGG